MTETVATTNKAPHEIAHWAILASAAALVVGALLPWYRFWFVTVNGIQGDGIITLVFGGVVALIAVTSLPAGKEWTGAFAAIMFGLCAVVATYHWATAPAEMTPQSGLVLTVSASYTGTIAGIIHRNRHPGPDR